MNLNVPDRNCSSENYQLISDGHFRRSNDFDSILISIENWDVMSTSQAYLIAINCCKCIEDSYRNGWKRFRLDGREQSNLKYLAHYASLALFHLQLIGLDDGG